jgi:hypothetical protein
LAQAPRQAQTVSLLIGCFDFSCYSISFHFFGFPFGLCLSSPTRSRKSDPKFPRIFGMTKFFARLANAAARQTAGYGMLRKCRNPNVDLWGKTLPKELRKERMDGREHWDGRNGRA